MTGSVSRRLGRSRASGPTTVAILASVAGMLGSRLLWPDATWIFFLAAGGAWLFWLAGRVSDDPWLARVAVGSYATRAVLTLAFFAISY